jgi:hypothetical protein
MSLHPYSVVMNQLEAHFRKVQEEKLTIFEELLAAEQITNTASDAYSALPVDSDTTAATLALVAYKLAIINEEPIRLSFTAKMAELQTVMDVIQAEKENWK